MRVRANREHRIIDLQDQKFIIHMSIVVCLWGFWGHSHAFFSAFHAFSSILYIYFMTTLKSLANETLKLGSLWGMLTVKRSLESNFELKTRF